MSDSTQFAQLLNNLKVSNAVDISTRYENITARLNKDFWDTDSSIARTLQLGSYGRKTAINGVSDLDMVFEIPAADYKRYRTLAGNGPSVMLQEVRRSLLNRYPTSDVRADGQVVAVQLRNYRVEVLPAFPDGTGDFIHGDTNEGGSWKLTKPRPEIAAVKAMNVTTGGVLRHVCRMLRAWKNQTGVGIGGMLIDTLAYRFFEAHTEFNGCAFSEYPRMLVSLFTYLGGLEEQEYWMAPGSGQRVRCKVRFQAKARKAAARCQGATDAEGDDAKAEHWRKVFGRPFPEVEKVTEVASLAADNEQFIEDKYPVDIRYNIDLECEIREGNTLRDYLRRKLKTRERVPTGRHLRFYVVGSNILGHFTVDWKVRNRGSEAIQRNMLRGEITADKDGRRERLETADFAGEHYVEVYAIKDGVCVAREHIAVPI